MIKPGFGLPRPVTAGKLPEVPLVMSWNPVADAVRKTTVKLANAYRSAFQNLARTPSFQTRPYVSKYTGLVG